MAASKNVALFFCLRRAWAGGMVAYTAHLYEALKLAGMVPVIYQPCRTTSKDARPFGSYPGIEMHGTSVEDCLRIASEMPSIIVMTNLPHKLPDKDLMQKLQDKGARVVIHDHTQFDQLPGGSSEKIVAPRTVQPPFLIRRQMLSLYPDGIFIPHPYVQQRQLLSGVTRGKTAVCTARIATSKRPRLILKANRLLPKARRVDMMGSESRITSYSLSKTYKDVYKFDGRPIKYPQTFLAPVKLCAQYYYHVDMSWFPHDGGGTQYAQLEAMDAECIPIMHSDWFRWAVPQEDSFVEEKNVIAVDSPEHLARVLATANPAKDEAMRKRNRKMLSKHHDPKTIGLQYTKELLHAR